MGDDPQSLGSFIDIDGEIAVVGAPYIGDGCGLVGRLNANESVWGVEGLVDIKRGGDIGLFYIGIADAHDTSANGNGLSGEGDLEFLIAE